MSRGDQYVTSMGGLRPGAGCASMERPWLDREVGGRVRRAGFSRSRAGSSAPAGTADLTRPIPSAPLLARHCDMRRCGMRDTAGSIKGAGIRIAFGAAEGHIMKLPRRKFLRLAAGAAAVPAVSRIARAQTYPTRSVRIFVGFAAGGSTDIAARLMGQWLSERLGQQFRRRELRPVRAPVSQPRRS